MDNTLGKGTIERYSRQLILPEIGARGQLKIQSSSVLIVGIGGLGCPAALYLAAAGIGDIGLVDYDVVELSNLQRQVLHTESSVGESKCESARQSCSRLNSKTKCQVYNLQISSKNAINLISKYDVIIDGSDNVATRYLLNDACVLCSKPLVSGSALRWEGQLTIYNHDGGPCYRCLFPMPPSPETVTNCSDGGVLGVVPGVIGCLQALETIKLIAGLNSSICRKLLLFNGLEMNFKTIKLRNRNSNCAVCGVNPEITSLIDYEVFCNSSATDKTKKLNIISADYRMTSQEYHSLCRAQHLLIDVRPEVEYDICKLPHSENIPLDRLEKMDIVERVGELYTRHNYTDPVPLIIVCRLGNDSQIVVNKLLKCFTNSEKISYIRDIIGGLRSWSDEVDANFPKY